MQGGARRLFFRRPKGIASYCPLDVVQRPLPFCPLFRLELHSGVDGKEEGGRLPCPPPPPPPPPPPRKRGDDMSEFGRTKPYPPRSIPPYFYIWKLSLPSETGRSRFPFPILPALLLLLLFRRSRSPCNPLLLPICIFRLEVELRLKMGGIHPFLGHWFITFVRQKNNWQLRSEATKCSDPTILEIQKGRVQLTDVISRLFYRWFFFPPIPLSIQKGLLNLLLV